jgi:hypothetical protein
MAWKKSALKHSQTFSCAKFDFMDMLLVPIRRRKPKRSPATFLESKALWEQSSALQRQRILRPACAGFNRKPVHVRFSQIVRIIPSFHLSERQFSRIGIPASPMPGLFSQERVAIVGEFIQHASNMPFQSPPFFFVCYGYKSIKQLCIQDARQKVADGAAAVAACWPPNRAGGSHRTRLSIWIGETCSSALAKALRPYGGIPPAASVLGYRRLPAFAKSSNYYAGSVPMQ